MRELYYGENLDVVKRFIPDNFIDLVYLDPPFNSNRSYNLLFRSPAGESSAAQVTAFEDIWEWGEQAEREFSEIIHDHPRDVAQFIVSLKSILKDSPMMAYLVIMASRLLEIHRVMKDTASLYLHCDVNASHYLKILLDAVFGAKNFRNEIIWHYYNKYSAGKRSFGKNFDQILFYTKSDAFTFNPVREMRDKPVRQLLRENVNGVLKNRKGPDGKVLYREVVDKKVDAVWKMPCLQPASKEMLGYPTQKPIALLERIILASSSPGDLVLDPFCGCGTAVHVAEKHGRAWIGIDVTHLAISVIENRLREAFPKVRLNIHGVPRDLDGARDLADRDKFEFQHWACWLVGARTQAVKKGPDRGVDGVIFFQDDGTGPKKAIVSVKGGHKVTAAMIRDLEAVMGREKAALGLFVTLAKPTDQMRKEALSAGMYRAPYHDRSFPRLQILTIEGLLEGTERPEMINLDPRLSHQQPARLQRLRVQQELPLDEQEKTVALKKLKQGRVVSMAKARAKRKRQKAAGN